MQVCPATDQGFLGIGVGLSSAGQAIWKDLWCVHAVGIGCGGATKAKGIGNVKPLFGTTFCRNSAVATGWRILQNLLAAS